MRIPKLLLAVLAMLCFFSFQSCKKSSDPAPNPLPTVKPDTLSAGWSKQVAADASGFSDIFFNTTTNGYLCSDNSLYKSTDGGINWVKLSLTNYKWSNCFVTADNKAFFIPQTNIIFKTLDGGNSFVNTTNVVQTPWDIFFADNNNGYCIANDGLFNTTDAGLSWQKVTTTGLFSGGYSSLSFINNTTGWVVSGSGIFRSLGSLTNWQASVVNGGSSGNFGSVYAVSATIVYAANFAGEIFKSTDGGANFGIIKKLEDGGFTDIHFLTNQIGYASAGRSIYKTTDGGTNWAKVVSLGQGIITEIHFTDAAHGWACGNDGVLLTFK